ncbi:hypothetical protein [Pseudarthrobacter defluvii]|uniref:hypothetical protein n=1 Tax=Pseudarthrobacter defluvii TaxID=410837 RepID=UPI0027D83D0D|nr:hypothetical protein [Pseudarthrobacter defluvii]
MILVVAVALWIVWVAPYVLRNRRQQFQPAGDFRADAPADERPDPHAGLVLNVAAQQEKAMEPRKSAASAAGTASTPAPARFRVRYGRTALALVGLLSLVTAFISGALLPFGVGSSALPLTCALLTLASVALLRWLAVRDRKAKVDAAFRSAMSAPARSPEAAVAIPAKPDAVPSLKPESPLFDAEAGQPKVKPLTAMELREAALAVAVAAGDTSAAAPSTAPVGTPWEPVEVPKPVYVEAAKAERPEPQPLELPEAPKAVGKPSLKKGAAGATAAEAGEAERLGAEQTSKAQSALSNLDDVLQRRRA